MGVSMKIEELPILEVEEVRIGAEELPDGVYLAKLEQELKEVEVSDVTLEDGTVLYYANVPIKYKKISSPDEERSILLRIKVGTKRANEEHVRPSQNYKNISKLDTKQWKQLVVATKERGNIRWKEYIVADA